MRTFITRSSITHWRNIAMRLRQLRWLLPGGVVLGLFVGTAGLQAQTYPGIPDSLLVWLDDDSTVRVRRNSTGEIEPAEHFTGGYRFQMYADSTCVTEYSVYAFRINGRRWKLRNWKYGRTVNTNAALLTATSRTRDTTLHAGDTINVFRELDWMDPATRVQDTNNFKSFDTLTYAIELVSATTGVRIQLLDSIGLLPRYTTGAPAIHGSRPIMAGVTWVVPSSLDGVSAFLRVRVRAEGIGEDDFTRVEQLVVSGYPDQGMTAYNVARLNYFDRRFLNKPAAEDVSATESSPLLRTSTVAGEAESVAIDFATDPNGGATSVAVYDGTGRLIFTPYTSASSNGANARAEYRFESSGLYLVCLVHNGYLVATRTITIGR